MKKIKLLILLAILTNSIAISQFKVDLGPDQQLTPNTTAFVTAEVTGGTPPYKYKWASTPKKGLEYLPETTSTVAFDFDKRTKVWIEVWDEVNEPVRDTVEITAYYPPLEMTLGPDIVECLYEIVTITANVNGGFPPYHYEWYTKYYSGNPFSSDTHISIDLQNEELIILKVSDSDLNFIFDTVKVKPKNKTIVPPQVIVKSTSNSCMMPTVLSATGNYVDYEWNNGMKGREIQVWEGGEYSVRGQDTSGCFSKWSYGKEIWKKNKDSAIVTIAKTPNLVGDSLIFDINFKVSSQNENCIPDSFKIYIMQKGTNLLSDEHKLQEIRYFSNRRIHETYGYVIEGVVDRTDYTKRISLLHVLSGNPFSSLTVEKIESKIGYTINQPSIAVITKGCYGWLLSKTNDKFALKNVYPNPTTSYLSYQYEIKAETGLRVILSDIQGRQFIVDNKSQIEPGAYEESIDLSGFKRGRYILIFYFDGEFASSIVEIVR